MCSFVKMLSDTMSPVICVITIDLLREIYMRREWSQDVLEEEDIQLMSTFIDEFEDYS